MKRSVIRKAYTPDVLPGTVGHAVVVPGVLWHVSPTGDPTGAWTTADGLPTDGLVGRLVVIWPGDPVPPLVVSATVPELAAEVDQWRAERGRPPLYAAGMVAPTGDSPAAVALGTVRLLRRLIADGGLPPGWQERLRAAYSAVFPGQRWT